MIATMQSDVDVALRRYNNLLAKAAHAHLLKTSMPPSPSATPRWTGRIRANLRQVVASFLALAAIG